MEKILKQEEINALLKAMPAASRKAGGRAPRKYAPFVFGKAARITKQQVSDVSQLHESFAYRLKGRLSAYLQVSMEVNQMSVDEIQYSEFTQNLSAQSQIASISIQPGNAAGLVSLDLPVAFAMIDLMLGGDGTSKPPERHLTEIEETILQRVFEMICDELQFAWRQVMEVSFDFDRPQRPAELFRLLPAYERILFLSFEIRMPDVYSTLSIAFPAAISAVLLRKIAGRTARNAGSTEQSRERIKLSLRDCLFAAEMLLAPAQLVGRDLLALKPGQTIWLGRSVREPAMLTVGGRRLFEGYPVRHGSRRAALVTEKHAIPLHEHEVTE